MNQKQKAKELAESLNSAVNAVLLARTLHAVEAERMAKLDVQLLDYHDVRDKKGERITDPERSWLMDDKYSAEYYADRDRRIRMELGYKVKEGDCPALVAECIVRKAERLIIEIAEKWFPDVTADALLCSGLDNYRKYIELLIGLTVNAPGYQAPKLAA